MGEKGKVVRTDIQALTLELLLTEYLCLPPPQKKSYIEALIPKVMVFRGTAFGR
jgi:hypothetical protein